MARGSIIKRGSRYSIIYYTPEKKQKWESGFERRRDAEVRCVDVLARSPMFSGEELEIAMEIKKCKWAGLLAWRRASCQR